MQIRLASVIFKNLSSRDLQQTKSHGHGTRRTAKKPPAASSRLPTLGATGRRLSTVDTGRLRASVTSTDARRSGGRCFGVLDRCAQETRN